MTMVASYIPWSFHEKVRGDFDFTGRRDPKANLKGFLDLVHKHGLYFMARSGPICLGEIDGGGPPDYANLVGGRSDAFLELTEAWVEAVSAVWRAYSIHISNFPWSPEFQCGSGMMGFGPATSQHQRMVTFFSLAAGMVGMDYYMFVERER